MSDRTAIGSSFKTQDTGHPIKSSDGWFRPVDIKAGPDGRCTFATGTMRR